MRSLPVLPTTPQNPERVSLALSRPELVTCGVKWNNQRKAVVAVLALAGAAFCVDRFVLGYGPRSASAATPIEAAVDILTSAPSKEAGAATPAVAARTVSLAERVASLIPADEQGAETPNAFALPAAWANLLRTSEPTPSSPAAGPPPTTTSGESFTLSSVFAAPSGSKSAARINGRLILVGQKINGHELLRLDHEHGKNFVAVLRGTEPGSEIRVPLAIGGDNAPPPGPDAPAPDAQGSPAGTRN